MPDFRARLADLRRPRLLMRAARFGLSEYSRDRDLKRLVDGVTSTEATVTALLTQEDKLEENRKRGDAAYSVAAHIDVLIAILAEARLVARSA